MGLCDECKEKFAFWEVTPWAHCHHEDKPKKHVEKWVNVSKFGGYYRFSKGLDTKEECLTIKERDHIATVKVEWDEEI
jgi:hypothetical protein